MNHLARNQCFDSMFFLGLRTVAGNLERSVAFLLGETQSIKFCQLWHCIFVSPPENAPTIMFIYLKPRKHAKFLLFQNYIIFSPNGVFGICYRFLVFIHFSEFIRSLHIPLHSLYNIMQFPSFQMTSP